MGGATEETHTLPLTFSAQEVGGAEVVGGATGDPQLDGPLPVRVCVWTVVGCWWEHEMPPPLLFAAASIKVQCLDPPPGVLAALASSRHDFIGCRNAVTATQ